MKQMNKGKCKFCDSCEIRFKEKESKTVFDIDFTFFAQWKWCRLHNNWCRYIAGKCNQKLEIKGGEHEFHIKYKKIKD